MPDVESPNQSEVQNTVEPSKPSLPEHSETEQIGRLITLLSRGLKALNWRLTTILICLANLGVTITILANPNWISLIAATVFMVTGVVLLVIGARME